MIGAFTATATKEVRDDIEALLSLRDPVRLVTGFDRKNLKFTVQQPKDKFAAVESFLAEHEEDCGIIYCLTRKNVEEVSLTWNGRKTRKILFMTGSRSW